LGEVRRAAARRILIKRKSEGKAMQGYLRLKESNCKNCYKCIRHCPVKSIKFSGNQAHIVEDECILCGMCFMVCPQNAKEIRSDVGRAKELIASGAPVYASIAPSFVANYDDATIKSMEKALKILGFAGAEETAIGATIVKTRYEQMLREGAQDIVISTCCHSVNTLVQKHFPELTKYLADVVSPMQAHCAKLKSEHPGAHTVFIGPCISKKQEAEAYPGAVDCVLTFEELSGWLAEKQVAIGKEPDEIAPGRARMFPTSGGILRTMNCDQKEYTYLVVDGTENCIKALKDIAEGRLKKCFIEMSACQGSCVSGPGMEKSHRAPVREYIAVNAYAGSEDFAVQMPPEGELRKELAPSPLRSPTPGGSAIEEILRQMGKTKPEDELNCGSCGYDSCREKAMAIFQGKADLSMCLPFLKEKAESFSDKILRNIPSGVIVLNEQMQVQQINPAACEIVNLKSRQDVLGENIVRILDPQPYFEVYQTGRNIRDKRVYLAEYKRYVEQSIIYDKSYHIILGILRDITAEEDSRASREQIERHTIEVTNQVIEKQMRTVQEIASLLGETTAETKVALTKLKESLTDE